MGGSRRHHVRGGGEDIGAIVRVPARPARGLRTRLAAPDGSTATRRDRAAARDRPGVRPGVHARRRPRVDPGLRRRAASDHERRNRALARVRGDAGPAGGEERARRPRGRQRPRRSDDAHPRQRVHGDVPPSPDHRVDGGHGRTHRAGSRGGGRAPAHRTAAGDGVRRPDRVHAPDRGTR